MIRHPDPTRLTSDDLPENERRELLEHVHGCERCRRSLASSDPARLFSLLALAPLPADALDRLSERVSAGVDRAAGGRPRRWAGAASIAASLVLAGFLGGLLLRHEGSVALEAVASTPTTAIEAPLAGIELISTPSDAQVVELAIGETQVVMIFDKGLDI
jgi:hypothetical protein